MSHELTARQGPRAALMLVELLAVALAVGAVALIAMQ